MSAKLMGMVFDLDLAPDEQAIMLCLADHAEDDGSRIYPGVKRLAWKSGRSERTVQRVLRKLEEVELIRRVNAGIGGRGHATEYRMDITKGVLKTPFREENPVTQSPFRRKKGVTQSPFSAERVTDETVKGDRAVSPQPPVEPPVLSVPPTSEHVRPVPKPTRCDPIWDALVSVIGHGPETKSERGAWNEAVAQLRAIDATPDEVIRRARSYRKRWPTLKFSPNALVSNWSEFPPTSTTTDYEPPIWDGWKD